MFQRESIRTQLELRAYLLHFNYRFNAQGSATTTVNVDLS